MKTLRGGDRPKNAYGEFADVTMMLRSGWEPWGFSASLARGEFRTICVMPFSLSNCNVSGQVCSLNCIPRLSTTTLLPFAPYVSSLAPMR